MLAPQHGVPIDEIDVELATIGNCAKTDRSIRIMADEHSGLSPRSISRLKPRKTLGVSRAVQRRIGERDGQRELRV